MIDQSLPSTGTVHPRLSRTVEIWDIAPQRIRLSRTVEIWEIASQRIRLNRTVEMTHDSVQEMENFQISFFARII
jgi:hypothetical protein